MHNSNFDREVVSYSADASSNFHKVYSLNFDPEGNLDENFYEISANLTQSIHLTTVKHPITSKLRAAALAKVVRYSDDVGILNFHPLKDLVSDFNNDSLTTGIGTTHLRGAMDDLLHFREEDLSSSIRLDGGVDHTANHPSSHGSIISNSFESSRLEER